LKSIEKMRRIMVGQGCPAYGQSIHLHQRRHPPEADASPAMQVFWEISHGLLRREDGI